MKYAVIEREGRFLLSRLPDHLDPSVGFRRITDVYIPGTRLRLRHVETADGSTYQWKLTQKYRKMELPSTDTVITNIYLDESEFEALRLLQGARIRKRRYIIRHDGHRFAVDAFEGDLEGLILAEVEFKHDDEVTNLPIPSFAIQDVTEDEFFTGGRLAFESPQVIHQELQRRLAV
jgi:CYTH domain-containing protein